MLTHWDPFAEMDRLQEELFRRRGGGRSHGFRPAVDVFDGEQAVLLEVELPGVRSEDVQVDFDDGILTIHGQRRRDEEGTEGVTLSERAFGSFTRSFHLPETVDPGRIDATLKDGVLQVHLPKRESARPRRIEVKA